MMDIQDTLKSGWQRVYPETSEFRTGGFERVCVCVRNTWKAEKVVGRVDRKWKSRCLCGVWSSGYIDRGWYRLAKPHPWTCLGKGKPLLQPTLPPSINKATCGSRWSAVLLSHSVYLQWAHVRPSKPLALTLEACYSFYKNRIIMGLYQTYF